MQDVGLFLNQQAPVKLISKVTSKTDNEKGNFFQVLGNLINQKNALTTDGKKTSELPLSESVILEDPLLDTEKLSDEQLSLISFLKNMQQSDVDNLEMALSSEDDQETEILALAQMAELNLMDDPNKGINVSHVPFQLTKLGELTNVSSNEVKINLENKQLLLEKLSNLWSKVESLLNQSQNDSTKKNEAQFLKLLEQWTSIEKQLGNNIPNQNLEKVTLKEGSKEQAIWSQLLQTYQKRTNLQSTSKYQTNSMVTSSDIAKWLKEALSKVTDDSSVNLSKSSSLDSQSSQMPISKIEQYVIHVSQGSNQEAKSDKLMDEFQRIITSSKFLNSADGKQLSLKLSPANLGEMMVKFTQIDGEMMVKITVTSQAAKEMLEGNMSQLRHMFAPQQVVVEKQETQSMQQEQYQSEKQKENNSSKQSNADDSHSNQEEQKDKSDDGASFHQLLMNEKV
ncbi:flagellar hook-length control protein FliK [Aquibacillus saliphilus]|uniref:flagellar hook-length control protein FliK n=1 Tax=Aquibacillus saliphilus TaxID=1909422 RepID=UPI001CF008E4|nr:flagellar hook-length control protein FliK [Aquibacillus saliphilus]